MTDILEHFPEGFTPRPQQIEACRLIDAAFAAGKRVVALELPTGGGKSYIAQTFARESRDGVNGGGCFVLTAQKILQDQYERDFPEPEIVNLKGRNAYPCTHRASAGRNCDNAPCTKEGKSILPECVVEGFNPVQVTQLKVSQNATICPYWQQVLKANDAGITMFNFSSFLFQKRLGRFGTRDLILIDEAHNIEGQLLNFVEFKMWESDLEVVNVALKDGLITASQVAEFIRQNELVQKVESRVGELTEMLNGGIDMGTSIERSVREQEKAELESLGMKLDLFLSLFEKTEWMLEEERKSRSRKSDPERVLTLRPVYAKSFTQDLLFSKGRRVLATSATLLSKDIWAKNLGLDPAEVEFIQMGSDFPVENRLVKREYVGSMAWKDKDQTIPKLVKWIKNVLLPRHAGERGIIHAHSFDLAKKIVWGVGSDRLLLHEQGMDKNEILDRHADRADSVIVAPAFHEGIDLKDDLARFAVIAKIPYPSTQDRVVKVRMDQDPGWYGWLTALKLIQSYGRSVRSKDDHAVTYIVDDGFESFLRRNGKVLPGWFLQAVEKKVTYV